ncbi:hypothetical protein AST99_10715 [Formosa algae]|nr:hypothetical protein AST99_10715 [Formosa algae]
MQPKKTVNIETLLHDMIDRDLVASFPERDFRLKQESSYNRASVSPNDTEGWFNNKDLNNNDTDRNLLELKKIMETENGY